MSTVKAAPSPTEGCPPIGATLPDSLFFDDPWWPLQVLEQALRGIMAEAKDNRLDNDDVERMTEPLFALAYDARRAAAAREDAR
jgi:hypothetical protein